MEKNARHPTQNKQTYFISKQKWYCTRALLEPNWYRKKQTQQHTHTHRHTTYVLWGGDAILRFVSFPPAPVKRAVCCEYDESNTKALPRPRRKFEACEAIGTDAEAEEKKQQLHNINKNNKNKNNTAAKTCPKKCAKNYTHTHTDRDSERAIKPEKSLRALVKAFNLQLLRPLTNLL